MPILSRSRIFPDDPASIATHQPLSILDCHVVRYSPSAAVWIYHDRAPCTVGQLMMSLRRTLNAYPHFAGQLHWAIYNPHGDHTQRYQRITLSYGTPQDPGVELIVATTSQTLSSLASSEPIDGCLASNFPTEEFLNATPPLALNNGGDYVGLPGMVVQITTLADRNIAVAVKLSHILADAQSLLQFTHDWASVNRAMSVGAPLPVLSPVFDPPALDRAAAGNIDAPNPDSAILDAARDLPLHRYDLWASEAGCPSFMIPATLIPSDLTPESMGSMGPPLPWANWDFIAPVSRYLVRFSATELQGIWEDASSVSLVSHLDALSAHIWRLIIRARGFEGVYHLNPSLGFRSRLDPPLPHAFIGSPLTSAKVASTLDKARSQTLGHLAASIRSSLNTFNASTLPALLHEMVFEASPLRLWNAFFGSRNTIVTSWLKLGTLDVDFGAGCAAQVEAVMPSVDGVIQVMEAAGNHSSKQNSGHWYNGPVTVSLHLRDDVMQKLLKDSDLRKYQ
ncbi:hypothetical protein H0H81_007026 [Sphagnurus paluster]|uniref:Transferase family protein n=1 Tax=Sphagnurus paluster TaxID=117069 RepID=A0A9P7G1J2_9AGAR|nr:hypothetical protein H0H81_007026 [Sphagnurus paluster]